MNTLELREECAVLQGILDELYMRIKLFESSDNKKIKDLINIELEMEATLNRISEIEEQIFHHEFNKI